MMADQSGLAAVVGGASRAAAIQQQKLLQQQLPPSLFDVFYEKLLTDLIQSGDLDGRIQDEFMQLQSDIERVDYLMELRPLVEDFEVTSRIGLKSAEKSMKYREEGNKLFQADQTAQAILFYNKSIVYAPHPTYDEYCWPTDGELDKEKLKKSKFETLALSYANRSAALRKLCQYEDCLRDIARAARFGYPKENMFKLWERKAKCYQGIKRFEMALKCLKQAVQAVGDSTLTENQKSAKISEFQSLIKEISNIQVIMQMGIAESDDKSPVDLPTAGLMGATGPMIFIPEAPVRKSSTTGSTPSGSPATTASDKPRPERKSVLSKLRSSLKENGPEKHLVKSIGGSYQSEAKPAEKVNSTPQPTTPTQTQTCSSSNSSIAGGVGSSGSVGPGELHKATSQISITQLSGINVSFRTDQDVPELSYGVNARMPSASLGIDLRFAPDRGRFFVATQDLVPGDVILREEPYAAVLEPIFRVNHCSHCLRKISTPIPCFDCATVQYCCETCRDAGWTEYHKIECGVLGYLEPSRYLGKMPHLAMRIITKTGLQNLMQHSMGISPTLKNGPQTVPGVHSNAAKAPSLDQVTLFDPTSYRSVHNLATNTDKRPFEDLLKKTAEAIFMAKCLKFNGFFGDKSENARRAEIFIASLLLRHVQIAATNGLEMAECIMKNNDITKFDIIPVGGAIFPTMSFFNHSCYPNALRLGYQGHQVIRVIRTIRKGEEVSIDYGFDFYANSLDARQKRANSQYHFSCKCVACINNWPTYTQLVGRERMLKVPATPNVIEEINKQTANYQLAMDYLIRLDISNAMPLFREYLIIMNELIEHPDQFYIDCEEAYKQCLWIENRGFKSKDHLHKSSINSTVSLPLLAR